MREANGSRPRDRILNNPNRPLIIAALETELKVSVSLLTGIAPTRACDTLHQARLDLFRARADRLTSVDILRSTIGRYKLGILQLLNNRDRRFVDAAKVPIALVASRVRAPGDGGHGL